MEKSYPLTLRKLIETLSILPGIGEKSANRLALFLLSRPEICYKLADLLRELPFKVKLCQECRNFSEEDLCPICQDDKRDPTKICIVETPLHLLQIEKTGLYQGYYYVLHYLLAPKEGFGPKALGLDNLIRLLEKRPVNEVILALSPTLSGEATSNYIAEVLKDFPIKISKLACGIPLGMELHFADPLTLKNALQKREILKGEKSYEQGAL